MTELAAIERDAMKLDVKVRGRLIARLLRTLHQSTSISAEILENRRLVEADRRDQDDPSGDVDGEAVFERLRNRHR